MVWFKLGKAQNHVQALQSANGNVDDFGCIETFLLSLFKGTPQQAWDAVVAEAFQTFLASKGLNFGEGVDWLKATLKRSCASPRLLGRQANNIFYQETCGM